MIKRNQLAVEKLRMEISCRMMLISQTQFDNEKNKARDKLAPLSVTNTYTHSHTHTHYLFYIALSIFHLIYHMLHDTSTIQRYPLFPFHNHHAITYQPHITSPKPHHDIVQLISVLCYHIYDIISFCLFFLVDR